MHLPTWRLEVEVGRLWENHCEICEVVLSCLAPKSIIYYIKYKMTLVLKYFEYHQNII